MRERSASDEPSVRDVVDAFRRGLAEGRRPRIEDSLDGVTPPQRDELLESLVALEVEHRSGAGEPINLGEYLSRFDGARDAVERAVASRGTWTGSTLASDTVIAHPSPPVEMGVGHVLGNYELLERLGAGGMGVVFRARHRVMDRIVAVKVLPTELTRDPDAEERFRREVRLAAKLQHPHVVQAHDADSADGVAFLVMEYVDGTDLHRHVRESGPLDVPSAVDAIRQAARGLGCAHAQGIVHRDVKPHNLILDRRGVVRVLDMGLARVKANDDGSTADLTQPGSTMGTYHYMSPEQAEDTRGADARSDVYALGCTLWWLLTGEPPYQATSLVGVLVAHREGPVPSLRERRSDVPASLQAIFQRMVAKSPDDRFQSMEELVAALDEFEAALSSPTIAGESAATPEPAARRSASKWWIAAVGVLAAVALSALLLRLQTPAGTLVLEIDDPALLGSEVHVDGKHVVTIERKGESPIRVETDAERHELRVTKEGFEVFTREFTVGRGERKPIRVSLEPLPDPDPDPKPGPKEVVQPPVEPGTIDERALALQLVERGATVGVAPGTALPKWISDPAEFPAGDWHIVGVTLARGPSTETFAELARCPRLRYLTASSIALGDDAAKEIAWATGLESLDLKRSPITDASVSTFGDLKQLERLDLGNTQITDASAVIFDDLVELKTLQLQSIPLTDATVLHFQKLSKLETLYMQGSKLTDRSAPILAACASLTGLHLDGSAITDAGVERLSNLANLNSLSLGYSKVTDAGLAHLSRLEGLRLLELSGTEVTGRGLAGLGDLPLERLTLRGCPVDGEGLEAMLPLADTLVHLGVLDTKLTAADIETLGRFEHLETLEVLQGNESFPPDAKARLEKLLPGCRVY